MLQCAQSLSARITGDKELTDDSARVRQAYRLVFGRTPSDEELQMSLTFLARDHSPAMVCESIDPSIVQEKPAELTAMFNLQLTDKHEEHEAAEKSPQLHQLSVWEQFAHVLLSSNEFAFLD
jgi:hypothetical protein